VQTVLAVPQPSDARCSVRGRGKPPGRAGGTASRQVVTGDGASSGGFWRAGRRDSMSLLLLWSVSFHLQQLTLHFLDFLSVVLRTSCPLLSGSGLKSLSFPEINYLFN
jgi:hypothetical protein